MFTPDPAQSAIIVGAGHAGVQTAESLRESGWKGRIVLIENEEHLPYQRPPLSKDHLDLAKPPTPLPLRAESYFGQNRIELRTGTNVQSIDVHDRSVLLSDGSRESFTKLVLATGASNRILQVPGADLAGVAGLKTLDDARRLRGLLERASNVVVVGAGFIGLEFAAAARAVGKNVTVLEFADRPMARALSPIMSDFFGRHHAEHGVDLRLGEGIAAFTGSPDGNVVSAVSSSGAEYPADLVVVGVGVVPNTALAEASGLLVENGILVDGSLRTSDPDIYAVGDCTSFPGRSGLGRLRLESVQNATDQARYAARRIAGLEPIPYEPVPWFWSIQGGARLQIAGLSSPGNQTVVRGDVAAGGFSVFCFDGDQLVAVESVNKPADHVAARKLLAAGTHVTPTQCRDLHFDLKNAAASTAVAG
ncbi:NAD(P)/FAD-dependent oxidoreductase [Paenarthrobacter sp. A20]|uniref:NAD(P)/FAD-dependent oxidoreductase n=1 Tax=Paenarthrobacter sp. A20 TaxID=2817891 RepID=UPI00209FD857|nr:FAD-dependent oxidoreductase [Paenarthrobacter sp. A20]MCP1415750.1 3-phenylpropionate/trans-cinnamate dioxygenase ferredoxin reductase subunit [Paenarthrobacter sp. A20]